MALPREKDSYENYTDQLVYFAARLSANPETASLAQPVETLLSEIDAAQETLRRARRAEIRARAQRDHDDNLSDDQVRRFRRQIDVVGDSELTQRLFPRGVTHVVRPRGRPQLERLGKLVQAIEELAASPRVTAHAEADEIKELLDKGKATIAELLEKLTGVVETWEAEALDVARAADAFNFLRADGVSRMGAAMGELRAKLGGDVKAAYAYTQQSRGGGSTSASEDEEVVAEADA